MKKFRKNPPICPVDYAFQRIGGKYKGRIIWQLHLDSIRRYGELRRDFSDITPKMLTQALREMEEDGLVQRKVYHEIPPKVEYSLSETGKELVPFVEYLKDWGVKQMAKEKQMQV